MGGRVVGEEGGFFGVEVYEEVGYYAGCAVVLRLVGLDATGCEGFGGAGGGYCCVEFSVDFCGAVLVVGYW